MLTLLPVLGQHCPRSVPFITIQGICLHGFVFRMPLWNALNKAILDFESL